MPSSTPIPQELSFVDFCNRKSLGFMHVNIRSLLTKFVLCTALAYSANSDVLAVSESSLKMEISIPTYNIYRQDRTAKEGAELQSTSEIACSVLSNYPGLCPNSLSLYF